jgi:hypothetical protein
VDLLVMDEEDERERNNNNEKLKVVGNDNQVKNSDEFWTKTGSNMLDVWTGGI